LAWEEGRGKALELFLDNGKREKGRKGGYFTDHKVRRTRKRKSKEKAPLHVQTFWAWEERKRKGVPGFGREKVTQQKEEKRKSSAMPLLVPSKSKGGEER